MTEKQVLALKKFLTEQGCYGEYIHNSELSLDQLEMGDCIAGAFPWADTPEGADYWESIQEEFNTQELYNV